MSSHNLDSSLNEHRTSLVPHKQAKFNAKHDQRDVRGEKKEKRKRSKLGTKARAASDRENLGRIQQISKT
jgi:hypothetical protein